MKDADGSDVGWIDLLTGQIQLTVPELAAAVEQMASDCRNSEPPRGAVASEHARMHYGQLV